MKRLFVVGMPRTGTTLVQSLIATNQNVFTTCETHYLDGMSGVFKKSYSFFDVLMANMKGYNRLKKQFLHNGYSWVSSGKDSIKVLDKVMTCAAKKEKKEVYLEKTPSHLYFTDEILAVLPESKIIFVVRNAEDTIKSYLNAARSWGKCSHELEEDFVFARWLKDTYLCVSRSEEGKGLLVSYDKLTNKETFNSEVERIESYIGLRLHTDGTSMQLASSKVVSSNEKWKKNNLKGGIIFREKRKPQSDFSKSVNKILEKVKV